MQGISTDGSVTGTFTGAGALPRFLKDAKLRNLPLNEAMFKA